MLLFLIILIHALVAEGQNETECHYSNCMSCLSYGAYHKSCYIKCTQKETKKKCTCNCPENCGGNGGPKDCPKSTNKSDKVKCVNKIGGCFVTYKNISACETANGKDVCSGSGTSYIYFYYLPCSTDQDCKKLGCKDQGKKGSKPNCKPTCGTYSGRKGCACSCPGFLGGF